MAAELSRISAFALNQIAYPNFLLFQTKVSPNPGTSEKEKAEQTCHKAVKSMTRCGVANCLLVLVIILLMLRLQPVNSQAATTTTSSGVHIVAGVVVVKPSIDGLWQKGEWDDANEYRFSSVYYQVNGFAEAYVRCKHDNSSLYWLIDVPSDNGATYAKGGQNLTGTAAFAIIPSYLGFVITASRNSTLLSFLFGTPTNSSQIRVAQQLGVSPHSSKLHRVYEISMPFEPLLQYSSRVDNLPAVNLDLTVTDSYGNGLDLSGPPYISVLEFGVMPVPENIEPLIPLALAFLTLVFCLHRKEARNGHAASGRPTE